MAKWRSLSPSQAQLEVRYSPLSLPRLLSFSEHNSRSTNGHILRGQDRGLRVPGVEAQLTTLPKVSASPADRVRSAV